MAWPLASDFCQMVQQPRLAFRDPRLQAGTIERTKLNQPRVWSGQFAAVFKLTDAQGRHWAVRAFTTAAEHRREHYAEISRHLRSHRLQCMVDFDYRDGAIRSAGDGKWYPLVVMDWVQGATLFDWLRGKCRRGKAAAIARAVGHWSVLVEELRAAEIAHGDLQHANILITPQGRMKLVDYDGLCVPALAGRRNVEIGVPPYQHPQRNPATAMSPRLDHFSALLIYVALRALAADLRLWAKHVEATRYDRLLFRLEDFRDRERSALYHDLRASPDLGVRELAGKLFTFADGPMERVPALGELLGGRVWPTAPRGPSVIDQLQIGPLIGRGRSAVVYRARQAGTPPVVALKLLEPQVPLSADVRQRVLDAMKPYQKLRHPGVARVLEAGLLPQQPDRVYFIVEYCDGGNLAQHLQSHGGKLRLDQARPLMLQCLAALACAHRRNLVHGDLRPQNILVRRQAGKPVACLTDFGLARVLEQTGCPGLTPSGRPALEYQFMPRERLPGLRDCPCETDVWGIAAVFYHMLTGRFPYDFTGREPLRVILQSAPPPLRERERRVPAALAAVIDQALAADPRQRFPSAVELKAAVTKALRSPDGIPR